MEFDVDKEFDKASKSIYQQAYNNLREIVFKLFDEHRFLSKEENLAIAIDAVYQGTGIHHEVLVKVWYAMWEKENAGKN